MVKLAQKYSKAIHSSNLKNDNMHFDTDALAAVALSSPLGALLFRVKYANDATSYVRLAQQWEWQVKVHAAKFGWPEHVKDDLVAKAALKFWLNDLCPVCGGKGKQKHEWVETLSDVDCESCEGTGRRPVDGNVRLRKYVMEMVGLLESMAIAAGNTAMRKLANEFS